MTLSRALFLALAVGVPQFAYAGFNVFTVGGDASCGFAFIQDAIDAAAAHPGEDYVFIASNRLYYDQHLRVIDQDVDIIGGFSACDDFDPGVEQTTIGGIAGNSVFEIEGSSHVYLGNLVITGAVMGQGHSGGGIYFGGAGGLTLQTVWVFNNQAEYGGGIDVSPSGPTVVNIAATTVSANTALVSGGGIRIEGPTTLTFLGPLAYIAQNAALGSGAPGYGGGLEVIGPAVANISAQIDLNSAPYGGGIAVFGSGNSFFSEPGVVKLFASSADFPVTVYGNAASIAGGGIYGKGHTDQENNQNFAGVCASDFVIDNNTAPDGSAVYLDWDSSLFNPDVGARLTLGPGCGTGVRCAPGIPCDEISGNTAQDGSAQPTTGATVVVGKSSSFRADGLVMRNNTGGNLIGIVGHNYSNYSDPGLLHNCLLAGNRSVGALIAVGFDNVSLSVENCTIAGNLIDDAYVFETSGLSLSDTIVFQPGTLTGYADASYVLASDISELTASPTVQQLVDPKFVNAAGGDYHLGAGSPGVDYAGGLGGVDFEGHQRDIDLPTHPNAFGPRDLGPYERQLECNRADTIFCYAFDD